MEVVLGTILSYLVSLAANLRTSAILAGREERLRDQFKREDALRKALAATRPLREELRIACAELARKRDRLGVTPEEKPLWHLLSDDSFQGDLVEWLRAGGIEEGNAVKERLLRRIETALAHTSASPEQIAFLRSGYFDAVDKAVFAHPILAHWRHQLSLDYLREQVAALRRRAEEAAGVYSPEKQASALDRYSEKALAAWDIIDLSNLPEGDIHMATQKLLLRQLYMPLRIAVQPAISGQGDDGLVARLEEQREARRHRDAGHLFAVGPDELGPTESRAPVGDRLGASRRLVVLGDPGGGKTTMLRWMATAYLLRYKGDPAFSQIPDTQTLPLQPWIPVLIRCRDLGQADLCRSFTDFLSQHLYKTELLPEEADVMRAVILARIAKGEILLLVDGLDEITDPHVRMMFSQELERTASRYPDAPIVVTSRIVGYRDMPYRMRAGFEHGVIAELNSEDKDLFARRWVEVTEQHQPAAEKTKRAQDLLDALHSSDRIERLTGNPMLLTTLALVKRKVGKLPNRRNKLYAEAVSVLLNWNPRLYETIEEDEAIPQLEYLAYVMCQRGVQRLADNEVLDLLEGVRAEYPNIRAIRRRDPQAFLALLEARSSILIKSGGVWQTDVPHEKPVWEFRHLTFQEFLAARALLDGRYPGRDKTKSLAEQVAPLAGPQQKARGRRPVRETEEETDVPESWREALRLLVADCKDDDVDGVLLSILTPMAGEDAARTGRARAELAALCLADEPNVSEETAKHVLAEFATLIGPEDGGGGNLTSADYAALEVGGGLWSELLKETLINEFCRRSAKTRWNPGGVWGTVEVAMWSKSRLEVTAAFGNLMERLQSSDRIEALSAALSVMSAAFEGKAANVQGLTERLFVLLGRGGPETHSAAWALLWLNGGFISSKIDKQMSLGTRTPIWVPSEKELEVLAITLDRAPIEEIDLKRYVIHILGKVSNQRSVNAILSKLDDAAANVRSEVIRALGQLGDKQAVPPLLAKLDDADADVRSEVIRALVQLGDKQAVPPLLAKLDDDDAANVRSEVIRALGQLGDKQAVEPLFPMLQDSDHQVCAAAAAALAILGVDRGFSALTEFLSHSSPARRKAAVKELVTIRGNPKEDQLLSHDLDGVDPWMDPSMPITDARITAVARRLGINTQEARSLYESIAADFRLRFA